MAIAHAIVGTADGTVTEIYYHPDFGIFQIPIGTVPGLTRVSSYYANSDSFYNRRVHKEHGELALTVPMACIEVRRPNGGRAR